MENKEPIKIRLSTVIFLIMIVILIAVIVCMYFYYNSNPSKSNDVANNSPTPTITPTNDASNKIELDIESDLVTTLYNYIPVTFTEVGFIEEIQTLPNAYQKNKVTFQDLKPEVILASAYLNSDLDLTKYSKGMDPSIFQDKVKQMYNNEVENKSFFTSAVSFSYADGKYAVANGGYYEQDLMNFTNIERAYEENDELYIIDNFLMCFEAYDSKKEELHREVYGASDCTSEIDNSTYYAPAGRTDAMTSMAEEFSSKAKKYKHTFKKNDQGEYYWYSTEPYTE